jgi:hypothetical protein
MIAIWLQNKKKIETAEKMKFMEHQLTILKKQLVTAASGAASTVSVLL